MQIDLDNATITIREAEGLVIDSAGGMKVLSGGDITLVGDDSNPGLIKFGSTYKTCLGANITEKYVGFWSESVNQNIFVIGHNIVTGESGRFQGLYLYSADVMAAESRYGVYHSARVHASCESTSASFYNIADFGGTIDKRSALLLYSKADESYFQVLTANTERLKIDINGLAAFSGNLLVNGGDIGITADTDLLQLANGALTVNGTVDINTIAAGASDYDKFLVSDAGVIKYRTGAQVLSDIGGARVKTGTYTGDGNISQAITGVGFTPKYVKIWIHPTSVGQLPVYEKLDQSWGDYTMEHAAAGAHDFAISYINSLDSDGFTIDDHGIDMHPNKLNQVYDYLAIG